MNDSQSNRVSSNLFWRFLERFGAQGVTFVVSVVLARVLDPAVYGSIALVTVITTILQVFIDSGLGTALIQKKDADNTDFSTVFFFNLLVCIFLFVGLFLLSPLISRFYNMPDLTPVIRALGIVLIISGFKNIQNAYVARNLLFKKYFFATLGGTVSAGIVGIWMAYNGYGIWALVVQNLTNQTIDTVILWITVKWRPTREFSWKRLKLLLSFGWKLLVSSLINTLDNQLRQLIIGKKYTAEDLAFYNKGNDFPSYATTAINSSIDSVLLPVLSSAQDDSARVKAMTRRAIRISSFCMWPMMMGLAACAKPLISLLLTDKWLPAVPYLVIFCFTFAFHPIHTANLNAINAMGRSDIFLRLEIIKKSYSLIILLVAMWFGPMVMAYSTVLSCVISQLVNSWPNRRLLNYKLSEQLLDIFPSVLLSICMGICVFLITFFQFSDLLTLVVQIPLGISIYLLGSKVFKMDSYEYIITSIKKMLEN